jgi:hypothetical protein
MSGVFDIFWVFYYEDQTMGTGDTNNNKVHIAVISSCSFISGKMWWDIVEGIENSNPPALSA